MEKGGISPPVQEQEGLLLLSERGYDGIIERLRPWYGTGARHLWNDPEIQNLDRRERASSHTLGKAKQLETGLRLDQSLE
jgi:hypothetical protein